MVQEIRGSLVPIWKTWLIEHLRITIVTDCDNCALKMPTLALFVLEID